MRLGFVPLTGRSNWMLDTAELKI